MVSWAYALNSNYNAFLVHFSAAGIDHTSMECQALVPGTLWGYKSEHTMLMPWELAMKGGAEIEVF